DVAGFGVELQRVHTALAADAGLFGATEGGAQIPQEPAVHPGDAHIDTCGHPVRPGQIGGPDSGRQTVVGIVGQTYDLVFPVERRDMTAGPEDLLTYHGGGFRQPGPDGRLYPGTGAQLCWELRNPAPGD